MAKGDYSTAEALAARGKDVVQFQSDLEVLRKRWGEICRGSLSSKQLVAPMWAYFQPILQALIEAGGTARRVELETGVERLMRASFLPGDKDATAKGKERWRVMVQRARRHLIAEAWIEDRPGPLWRITDDGRNAAKKPITQDPAGR
jgi:hypothetical protein